MMHADGFGQPNVFGESEEMGSDRRHSFAVHENGSGSDMEAGEGRDAPSEFQAPDAPVSRRSRGAATVRRGVVAAALFGVVAGVASAVAFEALGVKESESLKKVLEKFFPHLDSASLYVSTPVVLLFTMAAAVTEELSYRGVVMGFIQRLSPRSWTAAITAAVVSAFLWAVLHLNITDAPAVKFIQIFALGLVFAWFARRFCIGAAIAAHLGLNVTAVVVGVWLA